MRLDVDVGLLARARLFQGLSRDQLAGLAFRSGRRRVKAGEPLMLVGRPAEAGYLVLSGQASYACPGNGEAIVLGPGAIVGETAMFVDTQCDATVIAETALVVAVFEREEMSKLLAEDRAMAGLFSVRIRERLLSMAYDLKALAQECARLAGAGDAETSEPEAEAPAEVEAAAVTEQGLEPNAANDAATPEFNGAEADVLEVAGPAIELYGDDGSNVASTGTWSEGRDQPRAESTTVSDDEEAAMAGVAQIWSSLRPRFDARQSAAR